jgi:hypothetical protein
MVENNITQLELESKEKGMEGIIQPDYFKTIFESSYSLIIICPYSWLILREYHSIHFNNF